MATGLRRGTAAELQPELHPSLLRATTAGAAISWVKAATRTDGEDGDWRRGRPTRMGTGDEDGLREWGPATRSGTGGERTRAPSGRCDFQQEEEEAGGQTLFFHQIQWPTRLKSNGPDATGRTVGPVRRRRLVPFHFCLVVFLLAYTVIHALLSSSAVSITRRLVSC